MVKNASAMITLLLTVEDQTQTQLDLLHSRKACTAVVQNISFLIFQLSTQQQEEDRHQRMARAHCIGKFDRSIERDTGLLSPLTRGAE
jgi:hypothetical protein